jgi:hypothetical protein
MADGKKSDSLWNWLGRQVGHVKKAVKADVTKKAAAQPVPQQQETPAQPQAETPMPEAPKVIYRDERADEVVLPDQPGVKLRRTVIDEVIVDEKPDENKNGV